MPHGTEIARQHTNSFDVLRLAGALLVVWFHQHLVLGLGCPPVVSFLPLPGPNQNLGILGVFMFFSISGYLNTLSLARSRSVVTFLINRALRIYPALAGCILFTIVLGLFFSDLRTYLSIKVVSYAVKNTLLFFGYRVALPGMFPGNVVPELPNGSLWTLSYEVKLYAALAVLWAICRYRPYGAIVLFAAASATLAWIRPAVDTDWWMHFSMLFLAGSAVAAIEQRSSVLAGIAAVAATAGLAYAAGDHVYSCDALLAACVIATGSLRLPRRLRPPLDLSYSIYLYGFPVQQAVATYTKDFWPALIASTAITLTLAAISVLYIELPALRLKRRKPPSFIASPVQPSQALS